MKSITSKAPGKAILLGEHSVVYGYPAIAIAISLYSQCQIQEISGDNLIFNFVNFNKSYEIFPLSPLRNPFPEKFYQIFFCLDFFSKAYDISFEGISIHLSSTLFPGSGLGSSASTSVSLIHALNTYYNLGLSKKKISEIAYNSEKIVHGSPSGIDNTICTFGKAIYYQNQQFEFLTPPKDFSCLITYTNIIHDTKAAIEKVNSLDASYKSEIMEQMGHIAEEGKKNLQDRDFRSLGICMNKNQQCLEKLGVSNNQIEEINAIASQNNAYGSKLTGAGLGGCVITLGTNTDLNKIARILQEKGYKSMSLNIDSEGVSNE